MPRSMKTPNPSLFFWLRPCQQLHINQSVTQSVTQSINQINHSVNQQVQDRET